MIKFEKVSMTFPEWELKEISFEIKKGSFTSILGPSGSGKTSILRIISGLEEHEGLVYLNEENVTNLNANERNIGFVFQNNSLFTHLNVFENIAFPLKIKKEKNIKERVLKTLKLINLTGFEKRNVNELSGGEQKRVAIGRALSFNPSILLLDEPLNGLDSSLKEKMKLFLKELQETLNITTVMVTHDVDEAFYLSDKIIVLNKGEKMQDDKPENIFLKPKNAFVKSFVSDYELIKGKVKTINGKQFIQGSFLIPVKKGEKEFFINIKKTNYKPV